MLKRITYGYLDPDEYIMICDICGCTIDDDCGVQENDKEYCDECYKNKKKEEEEKDVGDTHTR